VTAPAWLEIARGDTPLLLSLPHTGTEIPDRIEWRLASPGLGRMDTDWRVHTLHAFARDLGVTTVRTRISRTVVDVNRDPSGASLYPGQATTELVPTTTFDGVQLYKHGEGPAAAEVAQRRLTWFEPYHAALNSELTRLRSRHARVVLWDAHSIRSRVPRLFPGELPVLNLGTNGRASCDPTLREILVGLCRESGFPWVADGRFKGGWITRHHGRPEAGVHAVQMEIAQRGYMDEDRPGAWEPERAAPLQAVLRRMLEAAIGWANSCRGPA
jgi:N-formylglutamate deformylase